MMRPDYYLGIMDAIEADEQHEFLITPLEQLKLANEALRSKIHTGATELEE